MNDLDEIARLVQSSPVNRSIIAGKSCVPVVNIKSVEDVLKRKYLPLRFLAPLLLLFACWLVNRSESFSDELNRHKALALSAFLFLLGLVWLFLPIGLWYGWKFHMYHTRPIIFWFRTPHDAANYRSLILRTAPQVPFVHREGIVQSWR